MIAGNGRLVAMKKLDWTECDVVELDLDELTATALGVALNRTAELAEWDGAVLGKLLDELRSEDALAGVGFSDAEIGQLLAELAADLPPQGLDDPGPGEPPEQPASRLGDLWLLGDHRLLCGDTRGRRPRRGSRRGRMRTSWHHRGRPQREEILHDEERVSCMAILHERRATKRQGGRRSAPASYRAASDGDGRACHLMFSQMCNQYAKN